jgi:O-antigen/teichoic acid export membrane protein
LTKQNKSSVNVLSISIGQFSSLLINFFSVSLTARYLGVEDYGTFNYLLAIVFIASKISDLGLSNIIFRETSKSQNGYVDVSVGISIRMITFFIVALLLNISILFLQFDSEKILLINIFYLSTILSSKFMTFRDMLDIPYKVNLDMMYSNIFNVIDNFIFLGLILLLPLFNGGIDYVILAYVFSNLPGFILVIVFLKKKYSFQFQFSFNRAGWIIKQSLPLAGFLILISIFNQVDIFLLTLLDSEKATGVYSVASRLIIPLSILPSAIATTFFPKIVFNFKNKIDNSNIYNFINKILFMFSVSMALIVTFKAKEIILLIFGSQYIQAYSPSIFLIWSFVFLFFSYVSLDFFTALDKQIYNLLFAFLIVMLSIILLIIFIPLYSFNAAGAIKLTVSLIGAGFVLVHLKKLNLKVYFFDKKVAIWILICAVLIYFISYLPLLLYVLLTPLIVFIITIKTHFFKEEELYILLQKFNKEHWVEKISKW